MKLQLTALCLSLLSMSLNAAEFDYITPQCIGLDDPKIYEGTPYGQLVQGKENWFFKVKELSPELEVDEEALFMLSEINNKLKTQGITLVMAPIPHRSLIYPEMLPDSLDFDFQQEKSRYSAYIDKLSQGHINVVDFSKMLNTDKPDLFYKRDHHWRPEGAKLGAEIIADYVSQLPVYEQLTKTAFKSTVSGIDGVEMIEKSIIEENCNSIFPKEYHKTYVTQLIDEKDGDALFDQVYSSEVVLVGTSFSGSEKRNFSGFFSEALKVDIANYSVTGGGVIASFTQYINSEDFKNNPPKVIVWEYPIRSLKSKYISLAFSSFKGNECSVILSEASTTLTLGNNMVAYNGGDDFVPAKADQVLYEFQFDDFNVNQFEINTHYIERRQFSNTIGHKRLKGQQGKFVFDQGYIASLKGLHFLALEIKVDDPDMVGTEVVTKVCTKEAS